MLTIRLFIHSTHPDNKYELVWGFDGYILSTCGASPIITVDDKRECGQGKIERIFSVRGPNNVVISVKQTIWIVDCDPLYINYETHVTLMMISYGLIALDKELT